MHTITIGNKYKCQLPASWAEVPAHLVLTLQRYSLLSNHPRTRAYQLWNALMLLCPQVPVRVWRMVPDGARTELLGLMEEWLSADPEPLPQPPSMEIGGVMHYMPGPELKWVSGMEFAMADTLFSRYMSGKDDGAVYQMAAILCRPERSEPYPQDWDGDKRIPWAQYEAEQRGKDWQHQIDFPQEVVVACLRYMAGCKLWVRNTYKLGTTEDDPPSLDLGFTGVMMDIAGTGVFGTFEAVSNVPITTLLVYLKKKQVEYLESTNS